MVTKKFCDRCGKETNSLAKIPMDILEYSGRRNEFSHEDLEFLEKEVGNRFSKEFEVCAECYLKVIKLLLNK